MNGVIDSNSRRKTEFALVFFLKSGPMLVYCSRPLSIILLKNTMKTPSPENIKTMPIHPNWNPHVVRA